MTYYHKFDYLNSLKKWNTGSQYLILDFKKAGRDFVWRGFRKEKMSLEPKLRPLDQLCFSSQFYFVSMLGLAGNLFAIIGIMILLEAQDNPYKDPIVFALLFLNQLVILLIEWITLKVRKWTRIWEISEKLGSKTEISKQMTEEGFASKSDLSRSLVVEVASSKNNSKYELS